MKKAFYILIALAAAFNSVRDSISFYSGEPATTWIWTAAILFSVSVFIQSMAEVFKESSQ